MTTTFEIGFDLGCCWSVNMVEVNTNSVIDAAITATRYAAEKAHLMNYNDYYVSKSPLADWQISEKKAKGMPIVFCESV